MNDLKFITVASNTSTFIVYNADIWFVLILLLYVQDREHGLATIQYANGDNYFGSVHNRKRSGHGLMEYANKDIYEGELYH